MEFILKLIRIIAWVLIFECAVASGIHHSIFGLLFSILCMTYWYWRYPVFKKDEVQED